MQPDFLEYFRLVNAPNTRFVAVISFAEAISIGFWCVTICVTQKKKVNVNAKN
jgi:hypothetical protein